MSPTRRELLAGAASVALTGSAAGAVIATTPATERAHPHSAGRYRQTIDPPAEPFKPVVLHVFGAIGEAFPYEHFTLRLELREDGQIDTCGLDTDFQLPAAGANERFTPAEFVERLIAVYRNPDLHEEVDMWPGVDWDALAEEEIAS